MLASGLAWLPAMQPEESETAPPWKCTVALRPLMPLTFMTALHQIVVPAAIAVPLKLEEIFVGVPSGGGAATTMLPPQVVAGAPMAPFSTVAVQEYVVLPIEGTNEPNGRPEARVQVVPTVQQVLDAAGAAPMVPPQATL